MPYSPYKSEAHKHQFKRYTAKGQTTAYKRAVIGFMNDKDNFTKEERECFAKVFQLLNDALYDWKSTLLKRSRKCRKKRRPALL